jgi:hypothetical protein
MRFFHLTVLALAFAMPQAASSRGFEFPDLQSQIETLRPKSVDDVLANMPASFRGRYTLMFASRSLQGASFEAPRAILYGPDARFIVTFNGDSAQRGYNSIETMEFDDATQQFRFREIAFSADGDDSQSVTISAANPGHCTICHGSPARPIWDGQTLWPGAYGERYNAKLSAEEASGMERFLARQSSDPRYQYLLGAGRFRNPEMFRPSTQSLYAGTLAEPPNAELSALLDRLVSQSIARELSQNPKFDAFQYLLLGVSDGSCGGLDQFYPGNRGQALRAAFKDYRATVDQANALQAAAKAARLTSGNRAPAVLLSQRAATTGLSAVRFIAERELNLPTTGWSVAFEKGKLDSGPVVSARNSLRDALLAAVMRHDPKVRELSDYATSSDGDRFCKYLKRQSRGALGEEMPSL